MVDDLLRRVEDEIERLRRRHAEAFRRTHEAREAIARWTLAEGVLRWHVSLEEVLEPDVDVEIEREMLIVRALSQQTGRKLFLALLPVPSEFDIAHPQIRFEKGYLEVRIVRSAAGHRWP